MALGSSCSTGGDRWSHSDHPRTLRLARRGGIGVLTAIAAFAAHDFWNLHGNDRFMTMNTFFEHWGLIAGCVLAGLLAEHEQRQKTTLSRAVS
jgi:hypothetical protein